MKKKPSLSLSVFVLLMIAAVLTCGIVAGIATIPLLVVNLFLVLIVSMIAGYSYRQLEAGMMDGVKRAIDCVLILVFVGVLIAAWISCGTVPMIIYYGLGVITPRLVLPFTFLICALLSTCIGTSLGTAGTAGVACVSIGVSMGIPIELLAGAAISGSILGDKLSPLSDSTILASSASDINIYHHVRSMIYATLPAFLVSLGAFYLLGARYAEAALDKSTLDAVRATLAELYDFRLVLLLPVVLIVVLCLKKVPAILAILISGFSGLALSVFVQGTPIPQVISIIYDGVKVETGVSIVNEMLSKGGITSMMATICTAVLALGLGGILSEAGYLHAVVERLTSRVNSDTSTVLATLACGICTVMLVTNFYVSAVLMGTMFREVYDRRGIHRSVLSRTIEEANTIILPLIPWNTSSIYYMGIFGFAAPAFAPYVIFAYANIAFSVLFALFGLFIFKADPADPQSTDWKIRGRRTVPEPQPEPAAVFAAEETAAAGDVAAEIF